MAIIRKLLRKNISAAQLGGYALAYTIGLAIIACAVKFYTDTAAVLSGNDPLAADYLTISQQVSSLNTLGIGSTTFSRADIADIAAQRWVRRVAPYRSATFGVSAQIAAGTPMSTQLFLESIPDDYLDTVPAGWNSYGDTVPVVMSREYLAMYNFGFATTRNLPQLSEGMLAGVPLTLTFDGNGRHIQMPARIAGFTSRINTIAVPDAFLQAANGEFGTDDVAPSRLIIEVSQPGHPDIAHYLESHGYQAAGDKAQTARAARMLTILSAVVAAVGLVITVLAVIILMLSITLLLQRNRHNMHLLITLGYTPGRVARPYIRLVTILSAVSATVATVAAVALSTLWSAPLADIGIDASSPVAAIVIAVVIALVTIGANVVLIVRKARKAFY